MSPKSLKKCFKKRGFSKAGLEQLLPIRDRLKSFDPGSSPSSSWTLPEREKPALFGMTSYIFLIAFVYLDLSF